MPERQVRDLELPAKLGSRPVVIDPLLTFRPRRRVTAVQRKRSIVPTRRFAFHSKPRTPLGDEHKRAPPTG
jgi:hypothetical protein